MATEAKIVISASDQTKAAIAQAQASLQSLGNQTTGLAARFGTLGLAISAAFTAVSYKGAVDMLDKLDDLSEKSGISTESLSALRYAGEVTGTSLDSLATGITKLSKNMAAAAGGNKEAIATFAAMGVSIKNQDGSLRSMDAVLLDTAEAFSTYKDGPEKAAFAMQLFGKSGAEMIPLLNLGASGIKALRDEASALGAVYGGDLAKEAATFNDNLKKLELASEAAKVSLLKDLVPSLNEVADAMIRARKEGGTLASLIAGFQTLVTGTDRQKADKDLAEATDTLLRLQNSLSSLKAQGFGDDSRVVKNVQQQIDAQNELIRVTQNMRKVLAGDEDAKKATETASQAKRTKNAPIVPGAAPAADHFADNFINQLITEYANLTGTVSKYDEVLRKIDTASNKFSATERSRALTLAGQIDAEKMRLEYEKQHTKDIEAQAAALDKLEDSQAKSAKTFLDNLTDLREGNKDQEFALSLIGQTTEAAEKLRFERELAKKTDDDANRIRKDFVDNLITEAEMQRRLLAIDQERQRALGIYSATRSAEDALKTDPARGMSEALREYQETVRDVAASTKELWANGIKGMEDALVSFVQTGKLDFRSLADSIIADMIRMQVRQSITGPLAAGMGSGGLGGAFNSLLGLFGQGKYIEGSSSFVGPSQTLTPLQFAEGGRPPLGVPSLIGERGPELFIPDAPGVILPSNKVGGASVTYAPQITIDSRSDRGQVLADVSQLLQRNNEQFAGMLRQQGVI